MTSFSSTLSGCSLSLQAKPTFLVASPTYNLPPFCCPILLQSWIDHLLSSSRWFRHYFPSSHTSTANHSHHLHTTSVHASCYIPPSRSFSSLYTHWASISRHHANASCQHACFLTWLCGLEEQLNFPAPSPSLVFSPCLQKTRSSIWWGQLSSLSRSASEHFFSYLAQPSLWPTCMPPVPYLLMTLLFQPHLQPPLLLFIPFTLASMSSSCLSEFCLGRSMPANSLCTTVFCGA
jgi:hypothetical protein